jgi:hypothetical protein
VNDNHPDYVGMEKEKKNSSSKKKENTECILCSIANIYINVNDSNVVLCYDSMLLFPLMCIFHGKCVCFFVLTCFSLVEK